MQEDPVLNQPIKSLQLMLKTIAYALDTIPVVNPDGIFDSTTEEAVRAFQQEYALPVTGVVDEETFNAITDIHRLAQELLTQAQSPVVNFPSALRVVPGQSHPHIFLAQAMFTALSREFPEFIPLSLTGTLDDATEHDLRLLQANTSQPVTGVLDKTTWNRLARFYRTLFDRDLLPSQG